MVTKQSLQRRCGCTESQVSPTFVRGYKFANLISKLNFYKLIPYPMDNFFTGRRDLSRQTPEKDILYTIPAGPVTECAFARWRIVLPSCLGSVTS